VVVLRGMEVSLAAAGVIEERRAPGFAVVPLRRSADLGVEEKLAAPSFDALTLRVNCTRVLPCRKKSGVDG